MSSLSEEQKQIIERKRQEAIERRNRLQQERSQQINNNNGAHIKLTPSPIECCVLKAQVPSRVSPMKSQTPYSRPPNDSQKGSDKVVLNLPVTLKLVSRNMFQVDMAFNEDVVTIFRKIESKSYDLKNKKWSFDIKDYVKLISELHSLKSVRIHIVDGISENVMKALIEVRTAPKITIDLKERLGSHFVENLFPFQKEGILFGIKRGGRCLIADEMGLGKTIQAIGLAAWFRDDWPLVVLCPSSLRYQWLESLQKWLPNVPYNDMVVINNSKDGLPQVSITIISYDLLARLKGIVENTQYYKMAIIDESHYIKSDKALRTDSALVLAKRCNRVVLLSGTPALSRPIELFPQISIIDPKLFPSKHNFGLRYCNAFQKTINRQKHMKVWDYSGAKNLDELRIFLEATLMIRRLKNDVLDQLPTKRREMVVISINHLESKEQKKLSNFKKVVTDKKMRHVEYKQTLMQWFSTTSTAKLKPVCDYLEDLIEKNVKFICFCHHQTMMDGISDMLLKKKVDHIRIDGATPPQTRMNACCEFQTKTTYKAAILSITAAGVGINLTAASTVVFAETYWNPGVLAQAEDRVHRIGQADTVRVIYLVAKGTVDDHIWPLLSKKLEVLNKAGLSKDDFKEAATLDVDMDQQLITEFFHSLDDKENSLFNEDLSL